MKFKIAALLSMGFIALLLPTFGMGFSSDAIFDAVRSDICSRPLQLPKQKCMNSKDWTDLKNFLHSNAKACEKTKGGELAKGTEGSCIAIENLRLGYIDGFYSGAHSCGSGRLSGWGIPVSPSKTFR